LSESGPLLLALLLLLMVLMLLIMLGDHVRGCHVS